MQLQLDRAKSILSAEDCTCVLIAGERVYTSRERGVRPLLQLMETGADLAGSVAADKVIGKAAAYLYVLIGVSGIHAGVISEPALAVLREHGITVTYDVLTDAIRNRAGTGLCPMEQAVMEIGDPVSALKAIRMKAAEMAK